MDIVCGDFASISCGTWLAIWNGAIGAFVAAVMGGLVALVVVRLTAVQAAKHAEQARQIQAISELVVGFESLVLEHKPTGEGLNSDGFRGLRAAWVRLYISGPDVRPLAVAIEKWPQRLYLLSSLPLLAADEDSPSEETEWDDLSKFVHTFVSCGVNWTRANRRQRQAILDVLEGQTAELLLIDLDARETAATLAP